MENKYLKLGTIWLQRLFFVVVVQRNAFVLIITIISERYYQLQLTNSTEFLIIIIKK